MKPANNMFFINNSVITPTNNNSPSVMVFSSNNHLLKVGRELKVVIDFQFKTSEGSDFYLLLIAYWKMANLSIA